jgi:hypothetical protein
MEEVEKYGKDVVEIVTGSGYNRTQELTSRFGATKTLGGTMGSLSTKPLRPHISTTEDSKIAGSAQKVEDDKHRGLNVPVVVRSKMISIEA